MKQSLNLFLGLVLPLVAQASVLNFAQVSVNPNFTPATPFYQDQTTAGTIDISGAATGGFATSGSGSAHVDYTSVKLFADGVGSMTAVARGYIRNDLMMTAAGIPNGTPGTVAFSILVGGSLSAPSGSSYAAWQLQADYGGGAFDINAGGHQNSPENGGAFVGDSFGLFTGTGSFQYGINSPLDIEFTATVALGYSFTSAGAATSDLAHSLYWAGISNVTANGSPVSSFTLTSGSGTNYNQSFAPASAPEPASGVLALGALGLIALLRRR